MLSQGTVYVVGIGPKTACQSLHSQVAVGWTLSSKSNKMPTVEPNFASAANEGPERKQI